MDTALEAMDSGASRVASPFDYAAQTRVLIVTDVQRNEPDQVGAALRADPDTVIDGNPYGEWIDMYAGPEYQEVAAGAVRQLDRLEAARAGPGRFDVLANTFRQATRLEAAFWDMGLTLAG